MPLDVDTVDMDLVREQVIAEIARARRRCQRTVVGPSSPAAPLDAVQRDRAPQVPGKRTARREVRLMRLAQTRGLLGLGVAGPARGVVEHLLEVAGRSLAAACGERLGGDR